MAPAKRSRNDGASGSRNPNQPIPVNWAIHANNRYLFRDDNAYRQYFGIFRTRPISNCYRLVVDERFTEFYQNLLKEYLQVWKLGTLAGIPTQYHPFLIRVFYANLQFNVEGMRFVMSTYMLGQERYFTPDDINQFLDRNTGGQTIYINKRWPMDGTNMEAYKRWFGCWRDKSFGHLSSTDLPAVHRLLFIIINNILIPKRTIKTNVEMSGLYFLRHLLQKDLTLNVGGVILHHMYKVSKNSGDSLPYASLIATFLLSDPSPPIGGQPIPDDEWVDPTDLVDVLPTMGWVENDEGQLMPNPHDLKNAYIVQQGAAPNQYGPIGDVQEVDMAEAETSQQPDARAQGSGDFRQFMETISATLESGFTSMGTKIDDFGTKLDGFGDRLKGLEDAYTEDKKDHKEWRESSSKRFNDFDKSLKSQSKVVDKLALDLQKFWAETNSNFGRFKPTGQDSDEE